MSMPQGSNLGSVLFLLSNSIIYVFSRTFFCTSSILVVVSSAVLLFCAFIGCTSCWYNSACFPTMSTSYSNESRHVIGILSQNGLECDKLLTYTRDQLLSLQHMAVIDPALRPVVDSCSYYDGGGATELEVAVFNAGLQLCHVTPFTDVNIRCYSARYTHHRRTSSTFRQSSRPTMNDRHIS